MRAGSVAAAPFLGGEFVSLYLGATRVPTVPGKAVITSSLSVGTEFFVIFSAPDDGGDSILFYEFYFDGQPTPDASIGEGFGGSIEATFVGDKTGQVVRVFAANSIGNGPLSAPFVATSS
jgi:hypothetical protein